MKLRLILLVSVFAFIALFAGRFSAVSAGPADCTSFVGYGDVPMETSTTVTFECAVDTQVYFGVCDAGNVPNDDLFNMTFDGQAVTYNYYLNTTDEYTVLGSAAALTGINSADLNSLNSTPYPPATYAYAISPNAGDVVNHLQAWCGVDWKGVSNGISSGCDTNVPVFTNDEAPSDGTLEVHVLLGNESARTDELVFATWSVTQGEQLNNKYASPIPSPRYVRVWWQAEGSSDWYLLTSQYWQGGGSTQSDYGLTCGTSPQPSYHTAFANAVAESVVYP